MKRNQYGIGVLILCILFIASAHSDEPGWVSLFNGNDLSGWVVKTHPNDQATVFWSVKDGALEADSMGIDQHDYVWLLSEKEYTHFILKLQFQAFRESPGNSGVQIRSRYDDENYWLDGPQIDLNPPGPWRCGMMWDETRENKRWIFPNLPSPEWVKETQGAKGLQFYYADDTPSWNDLMIEANGNRITADLNSLRITDFDGEGILNDVIHQKYRVGQKGYIALQIHRNDKLRIRFREIYIKELE